ncbi:MAG TPA: hypothetical protein VLA56_17565 [Pseudomonadales bacterium]|nr:hypothetical protein [Pseudomonadales bacterium]
MTRPAGTGRGILSSLIRARHGDLTCVLQKDASINRFDFAGTLTDADLHACLRDLWQHPDYVFDGPELYDLRATVADALTAEGVRAIGDLSSAEFEGRPDFRSAVVTGAPLLFGFARMFGAYIGDRSGNLNVFEDVPSALRWLEEGRP